MYEVDEDRHLHERAYDGCECLTGVDAENGYSHSNGKFKVVGRGGEREGCGLSVVGTHFTAHVEGDEEHDYEIYKERDRDADNIKGNLDDVLTLQREHDKNGKKQGKSISYFSSGVIAEESEWNMGTRNGIWNLYFENAVLKMSTSFINGKRNGEFSLYYPDKHLEWKGTYQNDKREGKWEHFDPTGQKDVTIEYKDGEALNAAELDAKEQELLKEIEKQKGKIPEPDEINFLTPAAKQ